MSAAFVGMGPSSSQKSWFRMNVGLWKHTDVLQYTAQSFCEISTISTHRLLGTAGFCDRTATREEQDRK